MPGIRTNTGGGWEVGKPQRFQDEATLHHLLHQNPHIFCHKLTLLPHNKVPAIAIRLAGEGAGLPGKDNLRRLFYQYPVTLQIHEMPQGTVVLWNLRVVKRPLIEIRVEMESADEVIPQVLQCLRS